MWDLNTIKYMNGSPKYRRGIDRMVKIIKVKEWLKKLFKSWFFWISVLWYIGCLIAFRIM